MRSFGFIQDPGSLKNLRRIVEIFRSDSQTNVELRNGRIPNLVSSPELKEKFVNLLSQEDISITFKDLVGRHSSPRATNSPCNGIIQAAIPGQKRTYIGDWPADNYLRWAVSFGFVEYSSSDDSFSLSEFGEELLNTSPNTEEEKEVFTKSLLAYPPVVRLLTLLKDGEVRTKFEIGAKFGFVDEPGFTSFPQQIVVKALHNAASQSEKKKIRSDWEGTSDKYVRMICGWIGTNDFDWVERVRDHEVNVSMGGQNFSSVISHSYQITGSGIAALRRAMGHSTQRRLHRRVCWSMLAPKGRGVEYLRNRRAHIIQAILQRRTIDQISNYLGQRGVEETSETILDDIKGLRCFGLDITDSQGQYLLNDEVVGLEIPDFEEERILKDSLTEVVDQIRGLLQHVPHRYLSLIEYSFDSKNSLTFEIKTIELLTQEAGFEGLHLGGSNRPDGIAYTNSDELLFGIIIDTKAYANGFSIPASERDKMYRYVSENKTRPTSHANSWWNIFPARLNDFVFLFVSSGFTGNFEEQLQSIQRLTNVGGAAVSAKNLLLLVESIKSNEISLNQVRQYFSSLKEIEVEINKHDVSV